jgi:hypothetical protein
MNTMLLKILGTGLLFLFTFLTGFWLSRAGKPFGILLFTAHKLIALGALVFLAITIVRMHQASPLSPVALAFAGLAALCFLVTLISGGLMSIDQPLPAFLLKVHGVVPYLTLVSSAICLILIQPAGSV